ncbi:DUF2267 domain-containing protein [Rhodospirillaceae bacterium SYSU D60014]|uniref:DUF2267 domain-containing protein n=1 Tax=Virgifigura deserti TaxID=2268457 RepID=UPI000E6675A9
MSQTGLEVFDETVQTTNIWLKELGEELGPDHQRCYHALRAVLHTLRDRLTVDQAAHLGAQLPMLVRGIYYEGWHPAATPRTARSLDEFLQHVSEELRNIRPIGSDDAARAVFRVLNEHLTQGEIAKVRQAMPQEVRDLWPNPPSA